MKIPISFQMKKEQFNYDVTLDVPVHKDEIVHVLAAHSKIKELENSKNMTEGIREFSALIPKTQRKKFLDSLYNIKWPQVKQVSLLWRIEMLLWNKLLY